MPAIEGAPCTNRKPDWIEEVAVIPDRMVRLLVAVPFCALAMGTARSQCLNWSTAFSSAGPGGWVYALLSFNDGSGPALYVGGTFIGIGPNPGVPGTYNIARWNGTTWNTVGSGFDDGVLALTAYNDGTGDALYAGGFFVYTAGTQLNGIARWNGSSWTQVGGGLSSSGLETVHSMTVHDDGSGPALYVGGKFNGGNILKWNGTGWYALWSGVGGGSAVGPRVYALASYDDGSGPALYAGGDFATAGGVPASNIAKWNGTSWSALGTGVNNVVLSLLAFDDGSGMALFLGGGFTDAGGVTVNGMAKWNGTNFSSIPSTAGAEDLVVFDDGSGPALYAGGPSGAIAMNGIRRWDGTGWRALGSGVDSQVFCLAVHDDGLGGGPDLYLGGKFTKAGANPSLKIAQWHGCGGPIDPICFGDASVAPCPCANSGIPGHGCENSAGTGGARLYSTGTAGTVTDTLALHSAGELPSALSIFIQGDALTANVVPFGDGLRCAGGNLKRLYVKGAVGGVADAPQPGDNPITIQSQNLGDTILPGSTRYYQVYYRDPDPGFCAPPSGSTFNASNGLRVVWQGI